MENTETFDAKYPQGTITFEEVEEPEEILSGCWIDRRSEGFMTTTTVGDLLAVLSVKQLERLQKRIQTRIHLSKLDAEVLAK